MGLWRSGWFGGADEGRGVAEVSTRIGSGYGAIMSSSIRDEGSCDGGSGVAKVLTLVVDME